jgi:lysophospholipase L1-like esterase
MTELSLDQISYLIQLIHLDRSWPALDETALAPLFGVDVATYSSIRAAFGQRASDAAAELLADPVFAACVDRLPFQSGATVVGIGDSITDDLQSWLEILRHLLLQRRPQDGINVVNAGISGNTTTHLIDRFMDIVNLQPGWILCMAGTKDASAHGQSPTKTLVGLDETAKNLAALRHFAASQTTARWIWMTPTPVIEAQVASHWLFGAIQMSVSNTDLVAIADMMRQLPDPVVDVQTVFGNPVNPDWLLSDGVHPSLAGHKIIVKAFVEQLSGLPSQGATP